MFGGWNIKRMIVVLLFAALTFLAWVREGAAATDPCTKVVAFIGHDAAYWHLQYEDALKGLRPADAKPILHPGKFLTYGCTASLYAGHGPMYWRHQLVILSQRAAIVRTARRYLGTAYLFGGDGPGGFDCSGFVEYVYRAGINLTLPRTTYLQWHSPLGKPVTKAQLRNGDEVFFYPTSQGPEHAGIYVGGGKFIDSPHTGAVVRVNVLSWYPEYVGARRFIR